MCGPFFVCCRERGAVVLMVGQLLPVGFIWGRVREFEALSKSYELELTTNFKCTREFVCVREVKVDGW